ncbi:MAG: pilus assembly protein PilM [Kiritimatiellia bacterium]|jgi:Tfp pilus assembly PilM family ATPase/Tfp pilus assembly protein PilN|nr:pilus assembly protein PilM [Kiritimatiellia bacterium]
MSTKNKAKKSGPRKNVVAVEIGKDWLKIIQAEPARKGVSVSKLHLERIADDDPSLADAISSVVRDLKFPKIPVIVCLPRQTVTVRILKLPSTDPAEVADMVELQVGKQTPYSREEILSDYRVIGIGREGYTCVMLAIVKRDVVRHRVNVLEEAGLDVERISLSSEGVLNWCTAAKLDPGDGRGTVLLDVDSFYTDLIVVQNGGVIFSRSILIGANQLLEEYNEWIDKFAGEIRRSLEICRGESPGIEFERMLISGAGPAIEGLSKDIGSRLDATAEPADSLQLVTRLPKTPSVRDPLYSPVSMTPLVGIALAPDNLDFDLMPETVGLRKRLVSRSRVLTLLGILVMTVLVSLSMYGLMKLQFKQSRLGKLRQQFVNTEDGVREVIRKETIIDLVSERQEQKFAAVNIFTECHRLKPEDVYFDQMDFDLVRARVTLGGSGSTRAQIQTLVNNLRRSDMFESVDSGGTTVDRSGRFRFEVVCSLKVEKEA